MTQLTSPIRQPTLCKQMLSLHYHQCPSLGLGTVQLLTYSRIPNKHDNSRHFVY